MVQIIFARDELDVHQFARMRWKSYDTYKIGKKETYSWI